MKISLLFKLQNTVTSLYFLSSCLQTVFVSTVKSHAMISCAPSESSNVAKDDDKDDEYFGSTESTDGTANDSSLSQTLHSAIKFEWVALNLLEEPRTNSDVHS